MLTVCWVLLTAVISPAALTGNVQCRSQGGYIYKETLFLIIPPLPQRHVIENSLVLQSHLLLLRACVLEHA
jgi:hypothetical protein